MDDAGNELLYNAQVKLTEARKYLYQYGLDRPEEQPAIAPLNFTIAQMLSALQNWRREIMGLQEQDDEEARDGDE